MADELGDAVALLVAFLAQQLDHGPHVVGVAGQLERELLGVAGRDDDPVEVEPGP